jgi:RNA polymerase sigma factor (sigma-70 family)
MSDKRFAPVLRRVLQMFGRHPEQTPDGTLLERFLGTHDEDAFAALVLRHGPMVWGVCRRVLRDDHLAEDAFQAAFLVLARKAPSIRQSGSVAGWLYRVAYRLALAAKAAPRPSDLPAEVADMRPTDPSQEAASGEVRRVLDEELNRLPERYRLPVVLCFFEGRTHAEAAAELNWPVGTVAGRLARAKDLLHQRLTRRGLTLSTGALGTLLAGETAQAVPGSVAADVVKAALGFAARQAVAEGVSGQATVLANGVLVAGRKRVWLGVGAVLLACLGALAAYQALPAPQGGEAPAGDGPPGRPPEAELPKWPDLRIPRNRMRGDGPVFSPDGNTLATIDGKTIKLWDVWTGKERATLEGHTDQVLCLAFSADGKTLASGGGFTDGNTIRDRSIRLWDLQTGKELTTLLKIKGGNVTAVALSPDGETLAAIVYQRNQNTSVRMVLLDAETGKQRWAVEGEAGRLAFSPDGKTLAALGVGVKLWDVQTGEVRATCGGAACLAFSPDSRTLATGGDPIRLWDVRTGKERAAFPGQKDATTSLAFSPDGRTLTAASYSRVTRWDVATLKEQASLEQAPYTTAAYEVAFSPDGRTFARTLPREYAWGISLWDFSTATEQGALKDFATDLAFSPDGKALATANDNTTRLWDVATGKVRATLPARGPLLFSPDGTRLVAGGKVWDVATGKELLTLEGAEPWPEGALPWDGSGQFSPDGRTFALCGVSDHSVKVWDAKTGRKAFTLGGATNATYSPDGRTLAISSLENKTVTLWDMNTGQAKRTLMGVAGRVAFSPNGKVLAAGGDRTIRRWDMTTGEELPALGGYTFAVWPAAFSPDGKTLAVAGGDDTVRLWEVATARERATLKDTRGGAKFSPDGRLLATRDRELKKILLWDVRTGAQIAALVTRARGQPAPFAFSPDSKLLASGGSPILLWDVSPEK